MWVVLVLGVTVPNFIALNQPQLGLGYLLWYAVGVPVSL